MMQNNKKIIVLLAAFIAIAVFIVTVWFNLLNAPREPAPLPIEHNTAGAVIPREVYAYNGIVKEAGNREFVLQSSANENYLLEDSEVIVRYDEHTQFVKNSVSKILPQGASFPVISEVAALASDINLGARVVVYAEKNIAGENNFLADKVIIFNISHSPVQ